jgi:hypothetical protein
LRWVKAWKETALVALRWDSLKIRAQLNGSESLLSAAQLPAPQYILASQSHVTLLRLVSVRIVAGGRYEAFAGKRIDVPRSLLSGKVGERGAKRVGAARVLVPTASSASPLQGIGGHYK